MIRTLRELVDEKSSDVYLFQALSRRFHAKAEEFFPPQIDDLLGCFADLGYADEPLLEGFAGRLDDIVSDASPRRVSRLLRNGAALRLAPEAWLEPVVAQLERHVASTHEGIPGALANLHAVRCRDAEMTELLLSQGLFVADQNSDDAFFTRVFERWSRHGQRHAEAEGRAAALAQGRTDLDVRDELNLLAGLLRCGQKGDASPLEDRVSSRLGASSPQEVATAAEWMQRLSLRSEKLWAACADSMELALKDKVFVRDRLPGALRALAALSVGDGEAALLARLLAAQETRAALPKYGAPQALQLLHAGCLAAAAGGKEPDASLLAPFAAQAARLARQLSLPERRTLSAAAGFLSGAKGGAEFDALAARAGALPLAALPPLYAAEDADCEGLVAVEVGGESLLRPAGGAADGRSGIRYLAFGDTFAGQGAGKKAIERSMLTPSCLLPVLALARQGWQVELRP